MREAPAEEDLSGDEPVSDEEFEERVKRVLHHLGLLQDEDDLEIGTRKTA